MLRVLKEIIFCLPQLWTNLEKCSYLLKTGLITGKSKKSKLITFNLKSTSCLQITNNYAPIPVKTDVNILDKTLTLKDYIKTKDSNGISWATATDCCRKSQLFLYNKERLRKAILKPWLMVLRHWTVRLLYTMKHKNNTDGLVKKLTND